MRWPWRWVSTVALAAFVVVAVLLFRQVDPYYDLATPEIPGQPLKELAAEKGLQIGSFASLKYLRERPYREILASQFEYVMADGEPNWLFEGFELRPARERFDFDHLDQVFAFAKQHDMPVRVQHLVWGEEKWLPQWLKQGDYSRQELLVLLEQHIAVVAERYKGKVREYSVVNEAHSRKLEKGGNRDWWGERLGTEYIDSAFHAARAADPDAVLILNDFGNESMSDITGLIYTYVENALDKGVPIDAIGMQMHIDGATPPSKDEVMKTMRRFAELGLKVYVTEFDVNMHMVHETPVEESRIQAAIYRDMLEACLEVGPNICPNFGFLGLTDRQSWYRGIGIKDANPLLFTNLYHPKPAFFAVQEALMTE
jgi:endo-1,4-beta-xylanase